MFALQFNKLKEKNKNQAIIDEKNPQQLITALLERKIETESKKSYQLIFGKIELYHFFSKIDPIVHCRDPDQQMRPQDYSLLIYRFGVPC